MRFAVPQVPGGATDMLARSREQRLSGRGTRNVVIEDRGGAGGTLGTDVAAKPAPDIVDDAKWARVVKASNAHTD